MKAWYKYRKKEAEIQFIELILDLPWLASLNMLLLDAPLSKRITRRYGEL